MLCKLLRNLICSVLASFSEKPLEWVTAGMSILALSFSVYTYNESAELKEQLELVNVDSELQGIADLLAGEKNTPILPSDLRVRDRHIQHDAKKRLDALMNKDPSNPRILLTYSFLWGAKGQRQQEEEYIKKALKLDSNYAAAYMALGLLYADQNRTEEALEAYKQVLEIDPNIAENHLNIGHCFYNLRDFDRAFSAYQKANSIDKDIAEVHLGLANVHCMREQKDDAIREYKEALELNPDLVNEIENHSFFLDSRALGSGKK